MERPSQRPADPRTNTRQDAQRELPTRTAIIRLEPPHPLPKSIPDGEYHPQTITSKDLRRAIPALSPHSYSHHNGWLAPGSLALVAVPETAATNPVAGTH
jgi:hypothetical protein